MSASTILKKENLNIRQQRFVSEYAKDLNGKQAAIRAGFSEKTAESQASRLLRNVKVSIAVKAALHKVEEKAIVTASYVLKSLKEVAEHCRKRRPIDSAGANRALELLGKHLTIFTEKVEHSGRIDGDLVPRFNITIVEADK